MSVVSSSHALALPGLCLTVEVDEWRQWVGHLVVMEHSRIMVTAAEEPVTQAIHSRSQRANYSGTFTR
jgi:hypothetical protein